MASAVALDRQVLDVSRELWPGLRLGEPTVSPTCRVALRVRKTQRLSAVSLVGRALGTVTRILPEV